MDSKWMGLITVKKRSSNSRWSQTRLQEPLDDRFTLSYSWKGDAAGHLLPDWLLCIVITHHASTVPPKLTTDCSSQQVLGEWHRLHQALRACLALATVVHSHNLTVFLQSLQSPSQLTFFFCTLRGRICIWGGERHEVSFAVANQHRVKVQI